MAIPLRFGSMVLGLATLAASDLACSAEAVLPKVTVRADAERADGPVSGYRATQSSTFTKTDTPLKEVPASITVVPEQLMKDQAMQSMGDVFRYVPGVLMHQGEGNRDQVVLRGNSTTADFYVDGIRDDAQVFRDLYNLERVEVLKGPAGMAFGRGSAGGVVNRVTKRPIFEHVGDVSLTFGSYSQFRGTIDVGGRLGETAAWRLNAMAESADTFRTGADLQRYAINPTTTLVLGERTALTLGYEHLHDDRTADRGFPSFAGSPFDANPSTFFGNANQSDALSTVDGFYATLNHDFDGGLQLKDSMRATHYDKYYQNVYPGSAVSAVGTMTLSAYNNANQRSNFFNQTDLTGQFNVGRFEHTLLAGFELGRQDSTNKRNTGFFGGTTGIIVPASNPIATATRFVPNGTDADNNVKADITAVYVQDQLTLSPQWKVLAGLRYDHFTVDFDDRRATVPAVDLSRIDSGFSPRFGVIWLPNAVSTYYVSYSYAMLPSGEQLALATTTADLAPEYARNYELGAHWDLRSTLTLSAAVFRLNRDDVHVADPQNPGYFVKTGQQRTDGVELGLQGEVTHNWQLFGGYAYLDGRITQPINSGTAATAATIIPAGNRIGLVPRHTLSVWNRFSFGERWGAGLGLIYQGDSYTSFNNSVKLPAFTRADGAVYYTLGSSKLRLACNVENMFNHSYFPTADGDNNISPGAPRTVRASLNVSF
jgi:catecholate siderophore receptor